MLALYSQRVANFQKKTIIRGKYERPYLREIQLFVNIGRHGGESAKLTVGGVDSCYSYSSFLTKSFLNIPCGDSVTWSIISCIDHLLCADSCGLIGFSEIDSVPLL